MLVAVEDTRDRFVALEKQRIKISLVTNFEFECIVVEALDDHVHVWFRNRRDEEFDKDRFVRYDSIVYVEPVY